MTKFETIFFSSVCSCFCWVLQLRKSGVEDQSGVLSFFLTFKENQKVSMTQQKVEFLLFYFEQVTPHFLLLYGTALQPPEDFQSQHLKADHNILGVRCRGLNVTCDLTLKLCSYHNGLAV